MSYSYLYIGKTSVKLNTLPYFDRILSIYENINTHKRNLIFSSKYYGIQNGSNNLKEIWNTYSSNNITLESQIQYYIYLNVPFQEVFPSETQTMSEIPAYSTDDTLLIPSNIITMDKTMMEDNESLFNISFEENNNLKIIQERACSDTMLVSITIPKGVTQIGNEAFYNCNKLSKILFEDDSKLSSLGTQTFAKATNMQCITIPTNVLELKNGLFNGCTNLSNINFENIEYSKLKSIGHFVFKGTKIRKLKIPKSVTNIGKYALSGLRYIQIEIDRNSPLQLKPIMYKTLYGGNYISIKHY